MLIQLQDFLREHHITVNGVIHVGAHRRQKEGMYQECGIQNVLWFDANPAMCTDGNVQCYAVCDVSDTIVKFNVTSFDQSSSMLELGKYSSYYPEITVSNVIEATTIRLDDYFQRNAIPKGTYNMMNLDIQGTELLALKGCGDDLWNMDIIYTEVNTAELYRGCCLIQDLDAYLANYNFKRVKTALTAEEWGDAIYIRVKVASTVRGGIGNQLYIFANLYAYAKRFGLQPIFDRRHVFHLHTQGECIWEAFPVLQKIFPEGTLTEGHEVYNENDKYYIPIPQFQKDVLLSGHFQCERYFLEYTSEIKSLYLSLFMPYPSQPYVGIHTRRGDYFYYPNSFRILEPDYYTKALTYVPEGPRLVVSEDRAHVWEREHIPADLYASSNSVYSDLSTLMSCSIGLVLSNSTFSWWAGYLNPHVPKDTIVFPIDYYLDNRNDMYNRYFAHGWTFLSILPHEKILERMKQYAKLNHYEGSIYGISLQKYVIREFTDKEQQLFFYYHSICLKSFH